LNLKFLNKRKIRTTMIMKTMMMILMTMKEIMTKTSKVKGKKKTRKNPQEEKKNSKKLCLNSEWKPSQALPEWPSKKQNNSYYTSMIQKSWNLQVLKTLMSFLEKPKFMISLAVLEKKNWVNFKNLKKLKISWIV